MEFFTSKILAIAFLVLLLAAYIIVFIVLPIRDVKRNRNIMPRNKNFYYGMILVLPVTGAFIYWGIKLFGNKIK